MDALDNGYIFVTFKIYVILSIVVIIIPNMDILFITILKSSRIFSKLIVMDILLVIVHKV